jgi:D-3-phosphoglycerate dehydrogenase/C-terminal binding protein
VAGTQDQVKGHCVNKVYLTDYISPPATIEEAELKGLAAVGCLLAKSPDDLIGKITDADGLIVFHETAIPKRVIETLKHCKVLVRCGVGFDNVDLSAAGAHGVMVCNVPDYGVDEVADHAIGLLLACNRGFVLADRRLRETLTPWNYHAVAPQIRLAGATMGIIGLGRLGTATALRAKALRMRVLAYDPYVPDGRDKAVGVEMADFDTLLRESDVISLHVPLTDETRNMIDVAALAKMKRTAILINTARGAVVDTDALAVALESGRIAGAGLDVLPIEPPRADMAIIRLWQQSPPKVNLVITPHCAFYSESGLVEMRSKAAREVARVLRGQQPRNCVNRDYLSKT